MAEEKCLDRESFRKAYIDPASRCKSNKRLARARQFGDGELQKWFDQLGAEAREAGEKARAKAEADRIAKEKAEREAAEKARIEAERIRIEKAKAEQEAAAAREIARRRMISELKTAREKRKNVRSMIAAGGYHTVGLKADGTVVAVGALDPERASWDPNSKTNYGQCNTGNWKNIVAVSAGKYHTVGLTENNTVLATGSNFYGQCDVSKWTNIIAIAAGAHFTVGLKMDGTVVATGKEDCCLGVQSWTNIIAIATGSNLIIGLRSDGTIITTKQDIINWPDIAEIAAVGSDVVGIKKDGTIVRKMTCNTRSEWLLQWADILGVDTYQSNCIGIKSNGTVNVLFGVTSVLYKTGSEGLPNPDTWSNIVAAAIGYSHVVGLKNDGTVVAFGNDLRGQCRVSDWKLFNNYEMIDEERKAEAERIKKAEAARIAAIEREEAQRREKIEEYMESKKRLEEELSTLHGLFALKRRKEIESILMWYDMEINNLK